VSIVATDVDDAAVVHDHVPHVIGEIARRGIHKVPCSSSVAGDREPAVRPDEDMVCIARIDRDPESRGIIATIRAIAKADRRCRRRGMNPRRSAVVADVYSTETGDPSIIP